MLMPSFDPGPPDETASEEIADEYVAGGCHVMALALHGAYGFEIGAAWDPCAEDVPEGQMGLVHVFVLVGDEVLDVRGLRTMEDMLSEWGLSPDDVEVTAPFDPTEIHERWPTSDEAIDTALAAFRQAFPHAPDPDVSPSP